MPFVPPTHSRGAVYSGGPPPRSARRPFEGLTGRPAIVLVVLLLVTLPLAATGCATSSARSSPTQITVFAAASLTAAFTKLGEQFDAAHPGMKVVFNFAGSQDLVAQLEQGAPADVLATADIATMDEVAELVERPRTFAHNRLEIVVATDDPKHITGLVDLADPDLKVVLAAPEVPAGKYAEQILDTAHVCVKPVSLEENVKGVVTKVSLGEADAGIVYVTDVTAANGDVDGVTIPDGQNVIASYPLAAVKTTEHRQEARSFVDMVLSAQGQETMASFGFLPR
jgi:molybdate transport system substrate-binding protein